MGELDSGSVKRDAEKQVGTRMKLYKRQKGHATWHWCKECSEYPTMRSDVQATAYRPLVGEFCQQCKSKEEKGDCQE